MTHLLDNYIGRLHHNVTMVMSRQCSENQVRSESSVTENKSRKRETRPGFEVRLEFKGAGRFQRMIAHKNSTRHFFSTNSKGQCDTNV